MERIPVAGPWITQREIDYVTDAVTTCWYGEANKYHDKLEAAFAEYVGARYAVSLPSCTSAIHLSLAALGVGRGDEVIVPDVTWIASAAPISYVGATAVFADIDEKSWCLSPESFEACITEKTKAVIVVDLYGSMPEFARICEIATRHGIAVVEDSAEAFGSQIGDRMAGSFGDTGVFSFHGSKTMTTGEGGMLVTNSDDLWEQVLFLRDHGRVPGDTSFFNREVAFKYKMSAMQAAMGLAQLERGAELVARKRELFSWYEEELSDVPEIKLNYEPALTKNSYWMVTAIVDPSLDVKKQQLIEAMAGNNIDCRPFFHPLSSIPAYSETAAAREARARNHVSYKISPFGINLPSGMSLTRPQVQYISRAFANNVDSCTTSQPSRRDEGAAA